jgi:hypothetical protein
MACRSISTASDRRLLHTVRPTPRGINNDANVRRRADFRAACHRDLRNTRALIVADHALELMCGLLRRGCLAATTVRIGAKPDEADFDLVLIPYATAVGSDDELIRLARGCLMPNGRVIAGARNGREAIALARRLRLNGFTDIRSTTQPGRTLLRATLRSVS